MSEMVMRIARAISDADQTCNGDYRKLARAAIEACFQWPKHASSLHLVHNAHKAHYQTVEQAVANDDHGCRAHDWVGEEQKQKAIAANDMWTLQWYPGTPVGFYVQSAADLPELLDAALGGKGEG